MFFTLPDELDPETVTVARPAGENRPQMPGGPTNAQILAAAKDAYAKYQTQVDSIVNALTSTLNDPTLAAKIAGLSAGQFTAAETSPFYSSAEVEQSLQTVEDCPDFHAFSVGVFSKNLPGQDEPGTVNFAYLLPDGSALGLLMKLDIFKSIVAVDSATNLQYGIWLPTASRLHDSILGLYASSTVDGYNLNVKILLTESLEPYGFVISSGANVAIESGVFAGSTMQWQPTKIFADVRSSGIFEEAILSLRVEDLRKTASWANIQTAADTGAPSNQQILDAVKSFYAANQDTVDTTAGDTKNVYQNHPDVCKQLTSGTPDLQKNMFTQSFADTAKATSDGLFTDTLNKIQPTQLFSTIGIGVNADVTLFVGGMGGLGGMWDIANRPGEGTRGYGFATGEVGLKVDSYLNLHCLILNLMPTQVDRDIYGITAYAGLGWGACFQVFYTPPGLTLLGYGIGAGFGAGLGAAIFGGHIWNFT